MEDETGSQWDSINRSVLSVCVMQAPLERGTTLQSLLLLDDFKLFSVLIQNCKILTSWLVWGPNIEHELRNLSKFKL